MQKSMYKSHYFAIILYQLKEVARRYNKDRTGFVCSLHISMIIIVLRNAISLLGRVLWLNIFTENGTQSIDFNAFGFHFLVQCRTVQNYILRETGN